MVEYNLPDDAEKYTILGNRRLLFVAISNILRNALKFSENNETRCEIYCTQAGICIKIKDRGIGIDQKELQHIFQPFYRAQNAFKHPGSGIGLSLGRKNNTPAQR